MIPATVAATPTARIGLGRCRLCRRDAAVNRRAICLDCHTPPGGAVTIPQLVAGAHAWAAGDPSLEAVH